MPGQLDEGVLNSVINANFKSMAELLATNVVSHSKRLDMIAEASVGQIVNKLNSVDPEESAALSQLFRSDLSKTLSELAAGVAAIQQYMKGAQTTPPPTA